jgi:hypothetical protein
VRLQPTQPWRVGQRCGAPTGLLEMCAETGHGTVEKSVGRAPLGVWGNVGEHTRVRGIWRMRRRTDRRDRRKQGVNREKRG